MNAPLIWLVDDSKDYLEINKEILEQRGLRVRTFSSIKDFHKEIQLALSAEIERPDLLVLDYNFDHEGNIMTYLKHYFKDGLKVPFFICSSFFNDEMFDAFMNLSGSYVAEGIGEKESASGFQGGSWPNHLERNILVKLKKQQSSVAHFRYKYNISSVNVKFDNLLKVFLENRDKTLTLEELQEVYCVTPKTMIKELTALRKHIFSTGHEIKHFRKDGGYRLTTLDSSCG